ncbi:hypothetical protein ACIQ4Z_10120 [Peribacillus asahii]|uniref:hypothetical protein n=1 Tax=Peribacillus asahii TaxID=228899 RepID=UPI0038001C74
MSKNKAIKVVTAAVIAGSAITAVAPAQSEAATTPVDKSITKANNQITKAFNAYYKAARFDNKLPSTTTIRKEAKLARDYYEAAKKQIAKNGGNKSKKAAYLKKLDTKKQSLNRVENYVKATNVNVAAKKAAFESAVKGGTQSKVLAAQTALDQKNAEFKKAVAKVFGPDARRLLTSKYYTPADKLSATVDNEMAVYKAYRDIERKGLIEKDLVQAGKLIASVEKQVAKIEKKNTKLAKNIMKAVNKNKAAYEKAKSGTVTSQKQLDALLTKAKDGDKVEIKVNATENLTIETTKALTITLTGDFNKKDLTIDALNTHVTNKAAESGKVTVKDVSNTSYEQVGSYSSIDFNDPNGGRIINSTSAPLNITIADGAKVTLVGNFGTITVLGNAEVTLAANSVVQELATDTAITVITEEGAKVETTTGSGTVTTRPSNPSTPPGGGGGGGGGGTGDNGSTPEKPTLTGVVAKSGDNTLFDLDDSVSVVDLSDEVDNSKVLSGIQLTTTPSSGVTLKIESLTAKGDSATNWIDQPLNLPLNSGVLTTKQLFGSLDTGTPGISLGNLRAAFLDDDITIKGHVVANNVESDEITLTIKLGTGNSNVTTFTNEYATMTKKGQVDGKHELLVSIKPDKYSSTIGSIQSSSGASISFAELLISFAASGVDYDSDQGSQASDLEDAIADKIKQDLIESIRLEQLVGKTFETDDYRVKFE